VPTNARENPVDGIETMTLFGLAAEKRIASATPR